MKTASPMVRSLLVLLVIAVIAGCAGSRTQESTGEYFDDSTITAKVKAAILGDPDLKVFADQCGDVQGHRPVERLREFAAGRESGGRGGTRRQRREISQE